MRGGPKLVEGFKKAKSSKGGRGGGGVSIFPASFFASHTFEIITVSQHFNIAVN